MHIELEHYRACTPQNRTPVEKKRRKTLSIRRFRVSRDGTKRLISVTDGCRTTKAAQEQSCSVEPFYVPVNTRAKNKDSKTFWDDGNQQ